MRLIDADALEKMLDEKFQTHYGKSIYQFIHDFFRCAIRLIKKAPTIDPESLRPQGEWSVGYYNYEGVYVRDCSYCGYAHDDLSPYCPSCGAKMKGAGENA